MKKPGEGYKERVHTHTVSQIMKLTGRCYNQIRNHCISGNFNAAILGRDWRIDPQSVINYYKEREAKYAVRKDG